MLRAHGYAAAAVCRVSSSWWAGTVGSEPVLWPVRRTVVRSCTYVFSQIEGQNREDLRSKCLSCVAPTHSVLVRERAGCCCTRSASSDMYATSSDDARDVSSGSSGARGLFVSRSRTTGPSTKNSGSTVRSDSTNNHSLLKVVCTFGGLAKPKEVYVSAGVAVGRPGGSGG
jgi:hypothetical protein